MPLPFILAGVAVASFVAAAYVDGEVTSAEKKGIRSGRKKVSVRIKKEINLTLKEIERYEVKIKYQCYLSVILFLIFFFSMLIFEPLAWLVVVVVIFISMNLLAEIVALYLYKDIVKDFRSIFWEKWKKSKLNLNFEILRKVIRASIMKAIRNHIVSRGLKEEITKNVNRKIEGLSLRDKIAHTIFGSSREHLVNEISKFKIDYDDVIKSIKQIALRIAVAAIIYSTIAFSLRLGIIETFSLGWFKFIALPIVFGVCFLWHRQRIMQL